MANLDNIIDWQAVNARYWRNENDLDLKRRKEAEFLVLGDIPAKAILDFLVFDQRAKDILVGFGAISDHVHIKPSFYF